MRILREFHCALAWALRAQGRSAKAHHCPPGGTVRFHTATSSTGIEARFLFLRFIYFYMYECSVHMQCLQRPERTSELLTLESAKAVSRHVAWVWVLWKSCPVVSPVLRLWPCLFPHKFHPPVSPLLPSPWLLNCLFCLSRKAWVASHGQKRSSSAASTALKKNPTSQIQDPWQSLPPEDLWASIPVHSQARPSFLLYPFPRVGHCSSPCVHFLFPACLTALHPVPLVNSPDFGELGPRPGFSSLTLGSSLFWSSTMGLSFGFPVLFPLLINLRSVYAAGGRTTLE